MVGIALVGLGQIARAAHLPAVARNPAVELVAVVEPEPTVSAAVAAEQSAARPDGRPVEAYRSLDEALARDDVAGVVLATPPWVTPALVVAAARSGRFVLAEKPVATSVAEAAAYDELTPSEVRRVQIGLTYRHDPAMQRLREVITSGLLGDRLLVRAHIYDEERTRDRAHTALIERTLRHGSPAVHEGSHVFDWLSYLLDADPILHDAWSHPTRDGLGAPNLIGGRLDYGGVPALVEFGWLTDALPATSLTVIGDHGLASLDGATFALTVTTAAGSEQYAPTGDRVARCFDRQLARFVELATGVTDQPQPGLAEGRRALTISHQLALLAERSVLTPAVEQP
ncbi:putative dehydrogenase [Naumannella cuiyingiana]|uniref:Putative dehydrogenase n=1 Tax=Naumannella cuiyingiana TaxID=1347891 RepID=A0A7Z0IL05_9ACTN|nr:Gfo/Idh/MocA family oxidoreductase [Naumannella cuiyingiana]NYI71076.1 putative dehydrogenase [Naumannella cuiyingiana]